ncbi:MAG TPA: hypothetical protein VFA20_14005 [Myxococcaceae bacterium]|nr:hypothetical protein [Myxococcaceae bacterium]
MFIFGTRLFGKVDAVPGLGHVATKFFHINFLPLIPLEGWFVLSQDGSQWRGTTIPMSGKSVLTAWMRFGLFVAGVLMTLFGFIAWQDHSEGAVGTLVSGVVCLAGFAGTYLFGFLTRAGLDRALQLAEHLGASPEALAQIRRRYETGGLG